MHVAVLAGAYLPAAQEPHDEAPRPEKVPAEQATHADPPATAWYWPAAQFPQRFAELEPAEGRYLPVPQARQAEAPVPGWYWPAAH